MKQQRWTKVFAIIGLISQLTVAVYAADESPSFQMTTGSYMPTTSLLLPYFQIPGFFVCPLQQPGELLAPFNQSREGYCHQGIDVRAVENTPVFAIADGVVTKAAPDSKGVEQGGGHMIFVDYGNGVEARYMHLNAYGVRAGDCVRAGDVIGFTGNTGDSSTPHLHFEYRINNIPIDPSFIFEASGMLRRDKDRIDQAHNQLDSFFVIQS